MPDENKRRGNWSGRFDYFFSCLGYVVGVGNVWRFPSLCYKHGGAVFLIPYLILMLVLGIPMVFLEMSLGQFTGQGPMTCWNYAPFFQGIGAGMVLVSAMVSIYYNIVNGWSLYYLFASFTSKLPWETCGEEWSTARCATNIPIYDDPNECLLRNLSLADWGACYDSNHIVKAVYEQRALSYVRHIHLTSPTEEYFQHYVTGIASSNGVDDLGPMRWKMVGCYLLAFVLVVLALSKSIKSLGKVAYFTVICPYVMLLVLFIRGLLLDGHTDGIRFYIDPPVDALDKLNDYPIWKDAAVQIFFSLSFSFGGLIALSSYNRFHNNCLRDAICIVVGNCVTSFFAGFVVFSYIGSLAYELGVSIMDVASAGPSLTFVVFPYAMTKLPFAPCWSVIFFLMMATLGLSTQFGLVETCTTALMDLFQQLRSRHVYKFLTVAALCVVMFLIGLPLTTNGGMYVLEFMDSHVGAWSVYCIAFIECISISYIYGIRRFMNDIETMLGHRIFGCLPFGIITYLFGSMWCVLTPLGLLVFMIVTWKDWHKGYPLEPTEIFPEWTRSIGWCLIMTPVAAFFAGALLAVLREKGSFGDRFGKAFLPTKYWGPRLSQHRQLVATYTPGLVVDPYGDRDGTYEDLDPYNVQAVMQMQSVPTATLQDGRQTSQL